MAHKRENTYIYVHFEETRRVETYNWEISSCLKKYVQSAMYNRHIVYVCAKVLAQS